MADVRLQRMASVLVNYCVGVKKGDRLGIQFSPVAQPLVEAIYREAVKVGALAEVFVVMPSLNEILHKEGSDEQLSYIPTSSRHMYMEFETTINIASSENTKQMSGVDPARIAVSNGARAGLLDTYMQRSANGSLRWNICMFPTQAYAQDAGMSLGDFEEFVYRACFLNDEDPIARWQELGREQERLVDWLKGKKSIHVVGKDTDLTLSIEGRSFMSDDGKRNFPGGEFFTSPVETSANGYIRYSFPASVGGRSVDDVRLRFENGVVVEANASQGLDYLEKMLGLDEGARRLGEFAFGNNPNVDRCTKNILFDEKMGGTIHLALGAGIPDVGGVNKSALHWDMVCDTREDCEIWVDGQLFRKDGVFVV